MSGSSTTSENVPFATGLTGERRQITVLFADMAGYTAVAERLGEEGAYRLMQTVFACMAAAVREQGGIVRDFTGDGIMAVFGVPVALEDAPLRACKAALSIQEGLAASAADIEHKHGVRPLIRVGVNTGPVVVGQIESGWASISGDTVNMASRLQTLAEPGRVVASELTHRLVQGLVESTFGGAHQIKGKSQPQKIYRIDAVKEGATRFNTALSRGLTPYVGREQELSFLQTRLDDATAGLRVVDIVADLGGNQSQDRKLKERQMGERYLRAQHRQVAGHRASQMRGQTLHRGRGGGPEGEHRGICAHQSVLRREDRVKKCCGASLVQCSAPALPWCSWQS
jgi:class 3 adenylate cyclase